MSSLGGPIGAAIGSLAGPLIGKIASLFGPSKQEREGRDVVKQFEGGFANMADMINKVGAAYMANGKSAAQAQDAIQRMWLAEKQGAEATKRALQEINEELRHHQEVVDAIHSQGFESQDEIRHEADIANQAYEEMLRSGQYTQAQVEEAYRHYQELLAQLEGAAGEAARAWLKAHQAADDAAAASSDAMKSSESELKGLIDKRDALAKGIAAEAWEPDMGSIEKSQRQELDSLDQKIQEKADQYAQLAKETGQEIADSIREALERLHVTLDVGYNLHGSGYTPPNGNTGVNGGNTSSGAPGASGLTYDDYFRDYWADDRDAVLHSFPGHARGGVFDREHLARIAEGNQPEMVGSVDFMTRALTAAFARLNHVPAAAAGVPAVTNHYYIDALDVQSIRDAVRRPGGIVDLTLDEIARDKRGRNQKARWALGVR